MKKTILAALVALAACAAHAGGLDALEAFIRNAKSGRATFTQVVTGQLRSMSLGFRGDELARLEITDGFGQRSQITFDRMELNAQVPAERFRFKPPQGAAVVKQ